MQQTERILRSAPVSAHVANFAVGFLILRKSPNGEDALPAGSGSLAQLGSVYGILTAAHVLQNLPDLGEIGLIRFPASSDQIQNQRINMAHAEKIILAADDPSFGVPDLAFLRLPPVNVGNLSATNVFYNLGKNRMPPVADSPVIYADAIVGVVGERISDFVSAKTSTRAKGVEGLFGTGRIIGETQKNGYDILEFDFSHGEDYVPPSRYRGVSGGGLWRVYCTVNGNGEQSILSTDLRGVAYRESDLIGEKRTIFCHGPKGIYEALIKKIREKWPHETDDD